MITSTLGETGVAEVVVDHPPVNALPAKGWFELASTLRDAGTDPATRVVLLRAEGRGFNAGVDLKELQAGGPAALIGANRGCFAAFAAVYECEVPVIAAVHGFCLGGVGLAGTADIIVASADATFGLRLRLVCPSQEFAAEEMTFGTARWLSCSRGIWESLSLGLERDLAMVMLQAPPVGDGVLDYLFSLSPNGTEDIRLRHALVEIDDARDEHLSTKILSQAPLIARLRATLRRAREHGHLIEGLSCYASSPNIQELAHRLDANLIDCAPALLKWGTKLGGRLVFRSAGVAHPNGSYHVDKTVKGLAATLTDLTLRFGPGRWMVKADSGFGSGHGNAIVDTTGLPDLVTGEDLIRALRPCGDGVMPARYATFITTVGAVAERLVTGEPGCAVSYPSVLAYLRRGRGPDVHIDFLGVHDQVIGDAGDYIACRFPADPVYRPLVMDVGGKVLTHLARLGVTGHVGIDFMAVASPRAAVPPALYATEINLRQTGTTHPHRTVRAMLDGDWLPSGILIGRSGHEVYYKATDGIIDSRYPGISSAALIGKLRSSTGLSFNSRTGCGVIPHLWPSLERHGKIGATFIGRSVAECDSLESGFIALLDGIANDATDSNDTT